HSPSDCHSAEAGRAGPHHGLVAAFLDHLRDAGLPGTFPFHGSAARHFLAWLERRRIPLASVDDTVVARFARHRCRCPRYSPRMLVRPEYVGGVRRFVHFLEDRGDIPVVDDVERIAEHLAAFAHEIETAGYSVVQRRGYPSQAEHFACWLRLNRIR